MKRIAASVLVAGLAAALTLASVVALIGASFRITMVANPLERDLATGVELLVGVSWLLGTTYVFTRLAVLIFAEKPQHRS